MRTNEVSYFNVPVPNLLGTARNRLYFLYIQMYKNTGRVLEYFL